MDLVWLILAFAAMGGLAWLGLRIEPHHVSKDGRRILCSGQLLSTRGESQSRWRETKVFVVDSQLHVSQRQFLRRSGSLWRVVGEADRPPRKRTVFLLRPVDPTDGAEMMALKLPASSRANDILRALR